MRINSAKDKRPVVAVWLVIAALALAGCDGEGERSEGDANEAAMRLALRHQEAMAHLDLEDRLNILLEIRPQLEEFAAEHPRASVSLRILGDENVGGMSLSGLDEEIEETRLELGIETEEASRQDANMLALAAGQAYSAALEIEDLDTRMEALRAVGPMLEKIVADHPDSEIALRIVGDDSVAGVSRGGLNDAIAETRQRITWRDDYGVKEENIDYILTAASDHGSDLEGLDRRCVKQIFTAALDLEDAIGIRLIIDRQLGRHHGYAEGLPEFLTTRYGVKTGAQALSDLYQPRLFATFGQAAEDCAIDGETP